MSGGIGTQSLAEQGAVLQNLEGTTGPTVLLKKTKPHNAGFNTEKTLVAV